MKPNETLKLNKDDELRLVEALYNTRANFSGGLNYEKAIENLQTYQHRFSNFEKDNQKHVEKIKNKY